MVLYGNLEESFAELRQKIRKQFKKEIDVIESGRKNKSDIISELLRIQRRANRSNTLRNFINGGHCALLPAYYMLAEDFEMAWTVATYLITWWYAGVPYLNEKQRSDLEHPELLQTRFSFWIVSPYESNKPPRLAPFDADDPKCNNDLFRAVCTGHYPPRNSKYDPRPEVRYHPDDDDPPDWYLHSDSAWHLMAVLPIALRQERHEVVDELLLRFRYIAARPGFSSGEAAKLQDFLTAYYVYDFWLQARRCEDPVRRKQLAWEAVYWSIASTLQATKSKVVGMFTDIWDVLEVMAEFELWEDRHEEFLRHFKKYAWCASISFFRKMRESPIEMIPFAERGLPGYDETKAMFDAIPRANK